jgi:AcrR family transcriptional regulator
MTKKKQDILNAAAILFAHKGYNETSIAELTQRTGVAEGTLFYHFGTKADLFKALLLDVKEGLAQEFVAYFEDRRFESGLEMVDQVLAFILYLSAHREEWLLLLHRHYTYEFARTNTECREHLEIIFNMLTDFIESAVVKGQKDGSIVEGSSRKTALLLFSLVNGLIWMRSNNLYDTSTLYDALSTSCRRMLSSAN